MTKVIFNADDFGYSNAVNYGIVDSYKHGILTSTTLMANMPGVNHAVELAKENEGLGIGVHLTLTCGRPVKENLSTIVDEEGNFKKIGFYSEGFKIDLDELYQEWDAQIQKIIGLGIKLTHIDSHHHAHTFGDNYKVAMELAKKYSLPLRNNVEVLKDQAEIKYTDGFIDDFDSIAFAQENGKTEKDVEEFLNEKYDEILKYDTVEVMCHPAYIDKEIMKGSSFNVQRVFEVEALIKSEFAKRIKESNDILLINYKDI